MAHLHRAVRERDLNAIAQILQQPDARDFLRVVDDEGRTPLDVALLNDANKFVVEALVRGGAHVSVQRILRAAEFEDADVLTRLCCVNPVNDLIINSKSDIHGRNALHIAISQRLSDEIIFGLLTNGADANRPDPDGLTPLHAVVLYSPERLSVITTLLQKRANPNALNADNRTVLLADGSGATPLYYAASAGQKSIVRELLTAGANPNLFGDQIRKLPLNVAVERHHRDIVTMLLETEANSNAFDSDGDCPLHLAVTMIGGNEYVGILIQHGCNVDLRDLNGATALHHAAARGDRVNIKTLLDAGANVNVQDEYGRTPLHYSVAIPYPKAIKSLKALFHAVPDLGVRDRNERTALHYAVMKDVDLEIIYLLIRRDPMNFLGKVNFD